MAVNFQDAYIGNDEYTTIDERQMSVRYYKQQAVEYEAIIKNQQNMISTQKRQDGLKSTRNSKLCPVG